MKAYANLKLNPLQRATWFFLQLSAFFSALILVIFLLLGLTYLLGLFFF